ncbi:MAG TPA: hypothetical protein VK999_03635, partial [Methylotenera sp.]|nr:hypothetical protein [Methylotenera sp.]
PNYPTNPLDYSVQEPVGYENISEALTLDSETNSTGFVLDFSELSIGSDLAGEEDLFGNVESIDITGKNSSENNTIYLSAQDILDLDSDGDDSIMQITGNSGDSVNLVDVDGAGLGTWDNGVDTGNNTTLYTYSGNGLSASVEIDNVLNVLSNTTTLDNS